MYSTYDWIRDNITIEDDTVPEVILIRDNRVLSQVGIINTSKGSLAIYKDNYNYCVHVYTNEWNEDDIPLLGYYDIDLSWDELLLQISNKYDSNKSLRYIQKIEG